MSEEMIERCTPYSLRKGMVKGEEKRRRMRLQKAICGRLDTLRVAGNHRAGISALSHSA